MSSLQQRFRASRESAPVESPLDKPASIVDKAIDAKVLTPAVAAAVPSTTDSHGDPSLTAAGLPATPGSKPEAIIDCDKNIVAAVKPADPSTKLDGGNLPSNPVKEAKADTAAKADEHADDTKDTVAAVRPATAKHANEDLDPQAAQLHPATCIVPMADHARETEAAYRALEEATTHNALEEYSRVAAALESLHEGIEQANTTKGGMTAESAFFAAMAVESFLKRFEVQDQAVVASFESAILDSEGSVMTGRTVVSTEALEATLEGVDHAFREIGKRTVAALHRTVTNVWLGLKFATVGLDQIAAQARKARGLAGGKITVKKAHVILGDGVPANVSDAFLEAAEKLRYLVVDFSKQAKLDYTSNCHTLAAAGSDAMGEKWIQWKTNFDQEAKKQLGRIWEAWRDPRSKLGGDPSAPIIGNYVFFEDQSLKYHGDDAQAKKFDEFANKAYPTLITYQHKGVKEDGGKVEIAALEPAKIADIAERLLQASKGITWWRANVEQGSSHPLFQLLGMPIKAARRKHDSDVSLYTGFNGRTLFKPDSELGTVEDALATSNRMRFHVGFDAGRALRDTIKHFKKIAKASLAAHVKASAESFDQMGAVDGASVNETAPNEPVQEPAKGNMAPVGEVMPRQTSWEDEPASFQTIEDEASNESINDIMASCESLMTDVEEARILAQAALEAEGDEKASFGARLKAIWARIAKFFSEMWARVVKFFTSRGRQLKQWAAAVKKKNFDKVDVKLTALDHAMVNDLAIPKLDHFFRFMDEASDLGDEVVYATRQAAEGKKTDSMFDALKANGALSACTSGEPLPAAGLVGAFKITCTDGKLEEVHVLKPVTEADAKTLRVTHAKLEGFVESAARLCEKAETRVEAFRKHSDAQWERAREAVDSMDQAAHTHNFFDLTPFARLAQLAGKALMVLNGWANAVAKLAEGAVKGAGQAVLKKDKDIQDADFAPHVAVAAESLIEEAGELAILSRHFSMEAEGGESAGPSKGFIERIKEFFKRVGQFFVGLWRKIVAFFSAQAAKFKAKVEEFKQYRFDKVTVTIPGELLAYQPANFKVPDFSNFDKWLSLTVKLADSEEFTSELTLRRDQAEAAGGTAHFSIGEKAKAASSILMHMHRTLQSENLGFLPAEMPGAFKIKLSPLFTGFDKEAYAAKEPEAQEVMVTHSQAVALLENAYRTVERLEKKMAQQEATLRGFENRWLAFLETRQKAGHFDKSSLEEMEKIRDGYTEVLKFARHGGEISAIFHRWTNACLSIASRVEQAAGVKKPVAATESIALPYWFQPTAA